jgi:alpha-glutamyl/putrescinyl thymine pyrophosphorylase clade 1
MSVISIGNTLNGPDLVVGYAIIRESMRRLKEAGVPPPLTFDPVLQAGSFTNVRREDDKTTRWYAANIRARYEGRAELLAATPAFLWFNLIRTGQTFTCVGDDGLSALDRALETNSVEPLRAALKTQSRPFVSGAYRMTPPRNMKFEDGVAEGPLYTLQRFLDQSAWRRYWNYCQRFKPPLAEVGAWYKNSYNFGTFQAGQNVACLKYAEPFLSAPDWSTWAYSGDGSRMGLNIVLGRDINARWDETAWLLALRKLRAEVMPRMIAAGVPELHCQDLQNVLCEVSKLWRFANDSGRLKKNYKPTGPTLTGSARAARLDELRADALARFAAGGIKNLDWLGGKMAAE